MFLRNDLNVPRAPAVLILVVTGLTQILFGFGKNKVQYREFDWRYVQSKHFDVYYYEDSYELAAFCADVAETSYVALKKDFKHDIQKRIPILVYNTHNEFQQTNVT